MRLAPEHILGIVAVAIGGLYMRGHLKPEFSLDFAAFCVSVVAIVWLIWPTREGDSQ